MWKYVKSAFKAAFSLIRFSFMKLFHYKSFDFSLINIVSPFAEISIDRGARLKLGKTVSVRSGARINIRRGAELTIGDNTFINHGCYIKSHKKISIGKNVQFGPNVLIYDHDHDFKLGLSKEQYKCAEVEIGDEVWIGANSVILRGSRIGNNCVIGAGSVIKGEYGDNLVIVQKRDTLTAEIER